MMKIINTIFLILICQISFGQIDNQLCINIRSERFVIGIDNPIDIVFPQCNPIKKEDIRVEFKHWKTKEIRQLEIFESNGTLYIRPDSIGYITFIVQTEEGLRTKTFQTKSIIAVGKLSRFGANHEGKISVGEFKAQIGLIANIESYDICGRCIIIDYETLRISAENESQRSINQGGKFEDNTREIIDKAKSGDIFVFRKIRYKCPGDDYEKRLADMTFEIE